MVADGISISYTIAFLISKAAPKAGGGKLREMIDFRGFLNARYAALALGGCFANFGL